MANIFLIASGSRSRTRREIKSKNPEGKRSNSNPNSNSDNNFSCKKHTKHRQSPGVCSLCLTERLSKVEYYDYTKNAAQTASSHCSSTASSSTSVSSCYSSSSVSSCSSPLQYRYKEKKKAGKKHSLFRLLLGSIVD
ncbi:hypothetical protein F2Q69_00015432 [Brassica cretica]|uniref:Uncharacterized protein n=1 Tax=Brassica cretica TaxID=69181 RepID=A0A8S9QU62_BRACR|nr:hypothetical protein F2Q69_00015432 [Brassica cretica]